MFARVLKYSGQFLPVRALRAGRAFRKRAGRISKHLISLKNWYAQRWPVACKPKAHRNPLREVNAVASVASESPIFPPLVPCPTRALRRRIKSPPARSRAATSPSCSTASRRTIVNLPSAPSAIAATTPRRRKAIGATTPRTRNPPRTKLRPRAKRRNPLKRRTKQRSTKQSQDAEPAENDKSADASSETAGAESPDATAEAGASADPTTDSAILTAAAADAILPAITADAPVAAAPTVASRGNFRGNILFISGRRLGLRRENSLEIPAILI